MGYINPANHLKPIIKLKTMNTSAKTPLAKLALLGFMGIFFVSAVLLNACSTHKKVAELSSSKKVDYKFNQKISREVLENYLNRSMSMQNLLIVQGNFDDNLRMIKNTGVKLIGRAVCQWGRENDIAKNLVME